MPSEKRLHPLSVLFSLGTLVRSFALPGIALLVTAGSAGWSLQSWQTWVLLLPIPYAIVGLGRYFTFRYRYEPHEMVIRTGFIFRNERHIPYARIQNLDGVQSVVHRLFGVVTVRVQTGGGQEPEATMSVLPLADFEEMRRRVFTGKAEAGQEGTAQEEVEAPERGRTLLHLAPRELMLHGFIENRGMVIIAAAFGLFWELGMADRVWDRLPGDEESGRGLVRALWQAVTGGGGLPLERIALTLAAFAGVLLLVRVVSMGWALVRLYGFRLTLTGEDLRTELGLLTRVTATIPLRRIQTLTIREGPLLRLFRRASVKADTAGSEGGEGDKATQREWLAPILRQSELPGLVREILPGLDLAAIAWTAAPARAFRRELKQWLLVTVPIALPFAPFLKWWALALLLPLLAWAFVGARQSIKHLGWAVTEDAVLFRSGWLWRKVSVARFGKIQAVSIHESPFDRRAAMARVRVDTAGAKDLSHRVDIPYLPRETARDLCDLLALQAAQTAFRW
jgi:putative membrane protein